MQLNSLDEKFKILEDRIKILEHEIERTQAVTEIQNLMGRYECYQVHGHSLKVLELFAQKVPDVCLTTPGGTYVGMEHIKTVWTKILVEEPVGTMVEHHLTTPMVEVAKDGKTAKGVWYTPGHETLPALDPHAYWAWGKYAVDFIKEDGKWKIWHMTGYVTFRTRFDRSWVETAEPDPLMPRDTMYPPDRRDAVDTYYNPKAIRLMIPAPPDPYETW